MKSLEPAAVAAIAVAFLFCYLLPLVVRKVMGPPKPKAVPPREKIPVEELRGR